MKSLLKTTVMVAIGIAAIIGVLMSDDIYAFFAIPCAASWAVNIVWES